jgi:hypothetical protein
MAYRKDFEQRDRELKGEEKESEKSYKKSRP